VATAALRLAVRFAFAELGLKRVELVIAVGNQASIRVAEKVGAQQEGILGRRLLLGGEWRDAVVYSLTDEQAGVAARAGFGSLASEFVAK
jgi:RimJ/RimL family protein N-acetyltransferase